MRAVKGEQARPILSLDPFSDRLEYMLHKRDVSAMLLLGRLLTVNVAIVRAAHNAPRKQSAEPAMPVAKHALYLSALRTRLDVFNSRLRCWSSVACLRLCAELCVSMCWLGPFHGLLFVECSSHVTALHQICTESVLKCLCVHAEAVTRAYGPACNPCVIAGSTL